MKIEYNGSTYIYRPTPEACGSTALKSQSWACSAGLCSWFVTWGCFYYLYSTISL